MARIRTLDFLPEIFQTPTNAQFLGATLDQLTSQPTLAPLQGYIGEHFGPGINPKDKYIPEYTKSRTDYQLEPGVVFLKPDTSKAYDFISYPGILDAINVQGGITTNPQQLFNNQFYSWDPFVDLDKLINFTQYYWLPNGPAPVTLTTNVLYGDQNYVVKSTPQGYLFDGDNDINPTITLLRGATYTFDVNQQSQFWIQGEPGLSGADPAAPNINTREILGVVNNGTTKGRIVFDVPAKDAQDFLTNLPGDYPVDLATDLTYLDFIDGYTTQNIAGITQATPGVVTTARAHGLYNGNPVAFEDVVGMTELNGYSFYAQVLSPTTFALYTDPDLTLAVNTGVYTAYISGGTITTPNWLSVSELGSIDSVTSYRNKTVLIWKGTYNEGIYKLVFINEPTIPYSTDPYDISLYSQETLVTLVPVTTPPPNEYRIVVQGGNVYALRGFYKTPNNNYQLIPYISANKDILYYQDSVFPNSIGIIQIVDDNSTYTIDVVADILGKKQARVPQSDPTGVTLTNGLKVKFQGNVTPAAYLEGEYYVEGVGESIQLIPTTILDVENEPFLIEGKLAQPDYITINRASKDRNAWSRSNRWFHSNVIQTVEQVNKTNIVAPGYNIKDQRAKRPVIEFRAGLKLFNQGVIGTDPVTWVDTVTTDALSTVNGQPFTSYHPDGAQTQLSVGDTIIFTADTNGAAATQFYVGALNNTIILEPLLTYQINEQSYITNGTHAGDTYWYDGVAPNLWNLGQRKQTVNQEPLFNVFNNSGISFSDTAYYPNTTFAGNKLFSFARGSGTADPIIGFPLKYNGVGNLGDITFDVNLYSASFTYTANGTTVTEKVSDGYVFDYTTLNDYTRLLGWQTAIENSIQYQVFTFTTAATNYNFNFTATAFTCDIPAVSDTATSWLNCALYIDSKLQDVSSYTVSINPAAILTGTNTGAVAQKGGLGYTPNAILDLTFNTPEGGRAAQGTATTDATGSITAVTITDGGAGYTFDSSGVNTLNTIPLITAVSGDKPTDTATFNFTLAAPLSPSTLVTINSQVVEGAIVNILLYSNSVSENAYFEIPSNLENNPLNSDITSISSGDIRLQYQSIYRNLPAATGPVFGNNNLHDLGNYIPYGTSIIQNSASMVLPGAFLRNGNHNLFSALKYNSTEYQKYKDLIIDNAARGDYTNLMTPAAILDDIIATIGNTRNKQSPFFWSDMLPSGSPYVTNTYSFKTSTLKTQFQLSRVYNFDAANYYGIQVYHITTINSIVVTKTLIRGRDYEVSTTAASMTVTYPIVPGDQIQIDEYTQTYGNYCPSTPSKLGMYAKYVPEVVYDKTYTPATWFIRGHDNSYNKLYGNYDPITQTLDDPRDTALLEFEQRVYNNIKLPVAYNQVDSLPVPLTSVIPGKFRTTGFTRDQVVQINTSQFLNWVGQNRIDYVTQVYTPGNEYTYNYNQSTDKLDNELIPPGYWRGVYNYFYDTDHPNTAPWEMLGFTSRPAWWLGRYGAAPYTSDNTLLWADLAQGINWNAGNPVVLPARVRPGLLNILPVDSNGDLISPLNSVIGQSDYFTFKREWVYGDQAPAETAYYRSSQWPFDAVRLLALTKPAQFFNYNVDVDNYNYNSEFNQFLYNDRYRLQTQNIPVYGNGTSTNSYINWIVDYEQQLGISAYTEITDILNNIDVRLVYRLAGFSSKDKLAFYVEKSTPQSTNNSLLIPDENYTILLYNNQPFDKIFYSSVIIQKVDGGFAVFGNGQVETYFNTVTPVLNGQFATFTQSGLTITVSTAYNAKKIIQIPYGHVFTTAQAVAEFLTNYGRYLELQGVRFQKSEGTATINWEYMIYEFLYWVASGWANGSTVNLNPCAKFFDFYKDSAVVQPLTIQQQNFVLNQNLLPINNKDMIIQRDGVNFALTPLNEGDTIAYTQLNVSNMEHAIVFDNKTVFNDVIYSLSTGLRQQRILLRGFKTAEWQGSVNPDGFILNRNNIEQWDPNKKYTKGVIVRYKNKYWVSNSIVPPSTEFNKEKWFVSDYTQVQEGLLPNPATRSAEATLYYDINNANLEEDSSLLSYSLIGFRPREYLVAGNLPDSSQVNVYKNMIQNKGTSLALNVFKQAQFPQSTIDYTTYENWAILGGQFGGVLNQNYIELELNETKLTGNPAVVALAANGTTTLPGVQQVVQLREVVNYGRQPTSANFLPTTPAGSYNADTALPTAGYANFDDVKYSAYNVASLSATAAGVTALNRGNYIWIADDNGTWAMYTAQAAAAVPILVVNNLDGTVTVYFNSAHQLSANNTIAITDYDSQVNGYYTVLRVLSDSTIQVTLNLDPSVQQIQSQGVVLTLTSQRVATPADIANLNLLNTEFLRNRVWVDTDTDTDWAVYEKTINYTAATTLSNLPRGATTSAAYTTSIGYLIAQGSTGTVTRYAQAAGGFIPAGTYNGGIGFGNRIAAGTNVFIIGDAGANTVTVYESVNGVINPLGTLPKPASTPNPSRFGTYLAISGNDQVIAVADNLNVVYLYARNGNTYTNITGSDLTVASGAGDLFGYKMVFDYSGNRLAISSPMRTVNSKLESGTVYVFDKLGTNTTYTLSQTMTQPSGAGYDAADIGAEFGRGLAGDGFVSELLTGAPYALNQVAGNFVEGAVYRFTDIGKKTGVVQGAITAFVDGTIYINGTAVYIFAATAAVAAQAINNNPTPIPNVIASSAGNVLTISLINTSTAQINNKLSVTGTQATLLQLGIAPYQLTQTIYDPHLENISQFGYDIAYNEQASFIVTAPMGNQFAQTLFDYTDDTKENDTIFDHDVTAFIDENINGGAVYMFDYLGVANPSLLNPGKYAYAQSVNPVFTGTAGQGTKGSAAQGSALLFRNFSTVTGLANGAVLFTNANQVNDWHPYRKSQAVVDAQRVVNVQIYNRITNETLGYIDTIDPIAGKILGIVEQNIDYIGSIDPAVYDVAVNSNQSTQVWSAEHEGRIWVDTSNVRWVNYHQNDTKYNSTYFATVFPGSVVSAYTWTESTVTPDQWPGPGIPYSTINYSLEYVKDSTGGLSPRYYFWVSDSNTVYTQLGKTLNARTVAQYIQDPLNSGVSYMGALNAATVALYNSGNDINAQTSVLHIGLSFSETNDDLHQQFDLIRENSTFDFLPGLPSAINDFAPPASLYSKFLDSLCGRDALKQLVPDPTLPLLVKTGTARRPRQTMFRDPFLALQNYITYANDILITIPVAEEKSASYLNTTGTAATSRTGRAFDTADYWQYVNWWATGYSNSTKIVQEVARYYLLQTLAAYEGMVVKVTDNGQGVFEVYIYQSATWVRIGLQNGTVQILPSLYATTTPELMPADAIYWILRALNEQIYTNDQLIYRNTSLILMFEYIVSEADDGQNYLPWLMKTSFLDVDHKLRELIEYENFQRDNEVFLEGYINETKPYHVVIKDFSLVYSKTDTYYGDITDFDVPSKYNSALGQFYSPQLQYNLKEQLFYDQYYPSNPIWQTADYKNWFNNYGIGLLPDGLPDFPVTKTTQVVNLPVVTAPAQNYGTSTAAIRVTDATALRIGQYITSDNGALPLNTLITAINTSTGIISLNKSTLTNLYTTTTLTAYDAIQVQNAYSLLGSGVFRIGEELIAYQSVDRYAGTVTGLIRGYDNTVPTEHLAGVTVYQDLPAVQVYDGARGYSLTLPPKITAYIDTNTYPAPRQAVSLQPNLNPDGTITSVDVVTPGLGYAVQPLIEVEPPKNPALTQYFALDDITYNNEVTAGTARNTISIIVPKSNALNIPTVSIAATQTTTISVLYAAGVTVGMGVTDYKGVPNPLVIIPANTTVLRVSPSADSTTVIITLNNAVTLPVNTQLRFVHQFRTGDPIRFKTAPGVKPPLGLLDNYYYYVGATGGVVTGVTLTSSGSNYIDIPQVKIQGGGGFGALAAASMSITSTATTANGDLVVVTGGVGYAVDNLVELQVLGQKQAVLQVTSVNAGAITGLSVVTNSGGSYTQLPDQVATLTTSRASVYSITLTAGGTGYTAKPTVSIILGAGAGATAQVDRMYVSSAVPSNAGTGYSVGNVLTIVGGVGTACTITVNTVDGAGSITSATITARGSYTTLPSANAAAVTGGGGSNAAFDLSFTVEAISLTDSGTNYQTAPTVQFIKTAVSRTGYTDATATTALPSGASVSVNNYSIAAITVVPNVINPAIPTGGVDYTTVPNVVISAGGGTGAAAIAVIDDGRPQSRIALFKNRADAFNNIARVALFNDGRTSRVKDYRLAVTAIVGSLFGGTTVRELTTTILFDRTSFTSNLTSWRPNHFYAGVYEDVQRLSSTTIAASTGLTTTYAFSVAAGATTAILGNRSAYVQSAVYNSARGVVTARFVTGVTTNLSAAAAQNVTITVDSTDNIYAGMLVNIGQLSTTNYVVSVNAGLNQITLNQAITAPVGQALGFTNYSIEAVGQGDYFSGNTTKPVVSVDNSVPNVTTIVYTDTTAPSAGTLLSFTPNLLKISADVTNIIITGYGIQPDTKLIGVSYNANAGYVTVSVNKFITQDLSTTDTIKLSTISQVLGSTAIASYEGISLQILTAVPGMQKTTNLAAVPAQVTFNWKNPSDLNAPLRIAPGQLNGQRLAFYSAGAYNAPGVYYYATVVDQASTVPVNNTVVQLWLDKAYTQPVTAFNFTANDVALVTTPLIFNRSITAYQGKIYECVISNNDSTFDVNKWKVLESSSSTLNALDRIAAFYAPTINMPDNVTSLMTGLEYPNATFLGVELLGESAWSPAINGGWDNTGYDYNPPPALNTASIDTFLRSPAMANTAATTYEVVGGAFADGYAPEEMVAGNVTDDVIISVKTRPGAAWDPLTVFSPSTQHVDHTGYKVITLVFNTSVDGTTYSFDNVTANPLSLDVFIAVQSIVKGVGKQELIRAYNNGDLLNPVDAAYPYTYTINWQNKTVTVYNFNSSLVDAFPANTEVQVSVNEIGGGNQLIRTSSDYTPFTPNTVPVNSQLELDITYFDPLSPASSFAPAAAPADPYIPPIVYNNGNRILYRGLISTTTPNPLAGVIDKIIITAGGSGYTSEPLVTIVSSNGAGNFASARATVKDGAINAIIVTNSGVGYTAAPVVQIAAPTTPGGTTALATAYTAIPAVAIAQGGRLYNPVPGETTVTFDIPRLSYPSGVPIPGGRAATGIVNVSVLNPNGATGGVITGISITDPGYGYQAGTIADFLVVAGGSGYNTAPLVRLVDPSGLGSGAQASATITGTVFSIAVTNGGSGYLTAPAIILTGGGGAGASATAVLGSGATAGRVVSITVDNVGTGYTHAPQVVFNNSGTGGINAAATATVTGSVNAVLIGSQGSGYSGAPIVIFDNTGTGGGGAQAITRMTGLPSTYNGGIIIGQPLSPVPASERAQAIATRVSNFVDASLIVQSISVTNAGSGYVTPPAVTFIGGGDVALVGGATALAILGTGTDADKVIRIDVLTTGSGYTLAPAISIAPPPVSTGVNATAVANMLSITALTYEFNSINNQAVVNFNRTIDTVNEYITLVAFGPSIADSGAVELNSYAAPETQLFKVRAGQVNFPLKNYALQENPHNAVVELNGRRISEVFYRVATTVADGERHGYAAPVPTPEVANLNDIWYQKLDGYVAVGDYGTIVTSTGGPNWVWQSQPATGAARPFRSVVGNYDNTSNAYKFTVAVGNGGQVYYNQNPFVTQPVAYEWLPSLDFPFASDLINVSYDKVNAQFMALGAVDTVYTTGGGVIATSGYGFAQVVSAGLLLKVIVTNSGSGYIIAPTVTISGGGGSGATATVTLGGGSVISITVTNPGSGYTSAPTITFSGGGGAGAAAVPVISSGFSLKWNSALAPALGWDDASTGWDAPVEWDLGTPVFASASHRSTTGAGIENMSIIACAGGSVLLSQNPYDLNNSVYTITLESGGSNYTTPTVTLVGGGGSGATATAVVSGGTITGITVVTAGSGYISNPTVVITDPNPLAAGASALASIDARVWVYISGTYTGTTEDLTSIAYDETDDYFMITGTAGTLIRLTPGSTTVTKSVTAVNSGYSFTVASAAGLTVGSRITGGPIPAAVYCYVTGINGNIINVTRNPTSADGTWTFAIGNSITFGNTITFSSETSGTTRDFKKIIWTDTVGIGSAAVNKWAAIGSSGTFVSRDAAPGVTAWTLAGLPEISSNSLTYDPDDSLYAITGNFGLVWTWNDTTLNTVRQFDPAQLQVIVNGNAQTYGINWQINLNAVFYKTLFDGEYAGLQGWFNTVPFDATTVWVIFNDSSIPAANATVKIIYQSDIPTYRIIGQTLTMFLQIQTGDALAVTTYNYTNQQFLATDFFTSQQVSNIISVNKFVTPALILTGTGTIIAGTSMNDTGLNYDSIGGTGSDALTGVVTSTVGGTGGRVSANLTATGNVKTITISPGGSGYTSPPTVIFGAPPSGGTLATGTAVINAGQVISITLTDPGAGYVTAPAISFDNTGTGGAGAGATCTLGYSIDATTFAVLDGGQGYTPTTTSVVWTGGGTPDREATVNWNISGDELNFVNGSHMRIDGVRGTSELNSSTPGNDGYYISIQGPYTAALYYDAGRTKPVSGPGLQPYAGGGYIWNYGAFQVSQPLWQLNNTDRLWVTVNGARVIPENLRIYQSGAQNELGILESFDSNTEIIVTSMTPYNTPGQENFSIQLKTDIDSEYNLYLTAIELLTAGSADWGTDPNQITVEIENPDLFGGIAPTVQVVLGSALDPDYAGKIVAVNVLTPLATGYTFVPKIRISGPGLQAPVCRAIMQQQPAVLGIVRRENPVTQTWLTEPLQEFDEVIYVEHAERLVEIYYLPDTGGVYSINVTNGGSGYVTAPTVSINGDGKDATAVAVLGSGATAGQVISIRITNAGSGYSTNPTVSFDNTGTGGTNAAASTCITCAVCEISYTNKYTNTTQTEYGIPLPYADYTMFNGGTIIDRTTGQILTADDYTLAAIGTNWVLSFPAGERDGHIITGVILIGNVLRIDGEDIRFNSINLQDNTVSALTRGYNNTIPGKYYPLHMIVQSQLPRDIMPVSYYTEAWNEDYWGPLQASETTPAKFLKRDIV